MQQHASPASRPLVSVIMANYNGARYLQAAVGSALAQTLRCIEVVVADDASTDDSAERVAAVARTDNRVRLLHGTNNAGPGAARNHCLDAARGRWLAVLDSDDLMHPDRLENLVAAAEADRADVIADDLLIFDDDPRIPPTACLRGAAAKAPFWVDAAAYVTANTMFGGGQTLGYLKPLLRTEFVRGCGVRYDPALRIGEDYDFVLRLLLAGARFRVVPRLGYFYRKHAQSISHRLSRATLQPMLAAHDRLHTMADPTDLQLQTAMQRHRASLQTALDFDDLVVAIKQRQWGDALAIAVRRPRIAALLRGPLVDRLSRFAARRSGVSVTAGRHVCVLSRQRIIGRTNGSSTYLLGLCSALRQSGYQLHLLCPSPAVFGRWPAMRFRRDMQLFQTIRVRRSLRIGPLLIALDATTAWRAAVGVFGKVLSRLGVVAERLNRPAPYAISQPWTRKDLLFVARHARPWADIVVADYAFLTAGIPYTLRPDARSLVVMHDLFSSRAAQFDRLGGADSVADIDRSAEMALLGRADAVVAIQAEEAAVVRQCLPARRVIVAPIAVASVAEAQPGQAGVMLFVGSSTAPNVLGLRWFIDTILPIIRTVIPTATLWVAGSVCGKVASPPDEVRLLGLVPDLAAVYQAAAVVVSPLQVGSGLKIKLIEALGHGKAMVVTSVTLQGVADLLTGVVAVADQPAEFAAAVIALLRDDDLRRMRATAALEIARQHFSPGTCYADLLDFVSAGDARQPVL